MKIIIVFIAALAINMAFRWMSEKDSCINNRFAWGWFGGALCVCLIDYFLFG